MWSWISLTADILEILLLILTAFPYLEMTITTLMKQWCHVFKVRYLKQICLIHKRFSQTIKIQEVDFHTSSFGHCIHYFSWHMSIVQSVKRLQVKKKNKQKKKLKQKWTFHIEVGTLFICESRHTPSALGMWAFASFPVLCYEDAGGHFIYTSRSGFIMLSIMSQDTAA